MGLRILQPMGFTEKYYRNNRSIDTLIKDTFDIKKYRHHLKNNPSAQNNVAIFHGIVLILYLEIRN